MDGGAMAGAPARRQLGPPLAVAAVGAVAALYGWAVFVSTFIRPGAIGIDYIAPGSDWMVMYETARLALVGGLKLAFDGDAFTAHLNTVFADRLGHALAFRPWVYPPSFLLILAPFAKLGFDAAYAAFELAGAALLVAALGVRPDRREAAGWIAFAALVCPAASINAVDGQCAFLVAALLVGTFRSVDERPVLAGVLLGLLAFKPQFGLLAPVALLAAGRWRTLAAAALTVLALGAASAAVFGADAWMAWARQTLDGYLGGNPKWVEYGRIWGCSVYACAVLLGATAKLASLLQTGAILGSAALVFAVFRSKRAPDVKLAILLAGTLLAAPHWAGYDAGLLVIAGGLWIAGTEPPQPAWRWILVLCLWLAPLIGPPALAPTGRLLPLLLVVFLWVVVRREGPDVSRARQITPSRSAEQPNPNSAGPSLRG